MDIVVDAHTHTVSSSHAFSTVLENVSYAKEHGMKMIGCTDHAHRMKGGAYPSFFWNLRVLSRVINDVIVLKGTEANIMDDKGNLDIFEDDSYDNLELVIASLHTSVVKPISEEYHTNAYINAIKTGRINIIGHPDDHRYPCDEETVIKAASEHNVAIEINNASMNIDRSDFETMDKWVKLCKEHGVHISLGTDAHFAFDVGKFDNVIPILEKNNFPEELILNTDVEKFLNFLNIKER